MPYYRYNGASKLNFIGLGNVLPGDTIYLTDEHEMLKRNSGDLTMLPFYGLSDFEKQQARVNLGFEVAPVADWNGTTGTDNYALLQSALDKFGLIRLPANTSAVKISQRLSVPANGGINGAGDGASRIVYTGTGAAIQAYNDVGPANFTKPPTFSGFKLSSPFGSGISVSEYYRIMISGVSFETISGYGIELRNRDYWTEGASIIFNSFRGVGKHLKLTIDDTSDVNHHSFAELRYLNNSHIFTGATDTGLEADPYSHVYANDIRMKANIGVDPAIPIGNGKACLVRLGANARIEDGLCWIYAELQGDRPFTRFELGANAHINAMGYVTIAPSSAMSRNVGATHPWDIVDPTAALYTGPSGEFAIGTRGESRLGINEPVYGRLPASTSGVDVPLFYLSGGTAHVTIRYSGTGVDQRSEYIVSTGDSANANSAGAVISMIADSRANAKAPMSLFNTGIKYSTPSNLPFFVARTSTDVVSDGVFEVTVRLTTFVNTGGSFFGVKKPVVLFPPTTGLTFSNASTAPDVGPSMAIRNGQFTLGNSGFMLQRFQIYNHAYGAGSAAVGTTFIDAPFNAGNCVPFAVRMPSNWNTNIVVGTPIIDGNGAGTVRIPLVNMSGGTQNYSAGTLSIGVLNY